MKSVGEGLKQMKDAQGNITTGLLPSEVTVTFNVTASASDSSKLVITASTPTAATLPVSGSFTGDLSSAISAARGNVVTIKFTNLLFSPENQFLTKKTAKEIAEILDTLRKEGVTIYLRP
jgi:deferrochelatase/peroxidase EfeB